MARIVLFVHLYNGHKRKKMDVEEEKTFIKSLDEETFIKSLDEKELMAYNIAKSHLGTLFSLDKSNAFLEWKAKEITKSNP